MKLLIIGGTGLISPAITRELLARGDAVTCYPIHEDAACAAAFIRICV